MDELTGFAVTPGGLRRKRFLMVSVAMLAVLGIGLGVSFAATTGSTAVSVSGGSTQWVFPVSNGASLPAAVDALKYTAPGAINPTANSVTTADNPAWTPVQDSAGTLSSTNAGDLAVIDATSQSQLFSMYVTDLHELQRAYSSYAWVVNVWKCASDCTTTGAWTQAGTDVVPAGGSILTNTDGFLQFPMTSGFYYVVTMDAGGSFYAYNTTSGDDMGPEFFFTSRAM